MDQEKIGKFIRKIRKENNLTQKELADKYNVTYQAVSKWELGKNIPDISLIQKMSKDFNISIDDILDGKKSKNNKKYIILIIVSIMLIIVFSLVFYHNKDKYEFKTLSTTCSEFKLSGSIAYDKNSSSIYISNIDYCGGDDKNIYENIRCNLYENGTLISSCDEKKNITLENYLKDISIYESNYAKMCKVYSNDSLYLEIYAKIIDGDNITYKIPLSLNNDCKK